MANVLSSSPEATRVGLMIPKFLEKKIEIIDIFCIDQKRNRKSQHVCEIATFRIILQNCTIHVSVVYIAPDANAASHVSLMDQILDYSRRFKNYIALGDFNRDLSNPANQRFYDTHTGGILTQMVKSPTRVKTISQSDGTQRTSSTIIDLVFAERNIKEKIFKLNINENTPSDHRMVEIDISMKIPMKYCINKYFMDPARRPPIPKNRVQRVNKILEKDLQKSDGYLNDMSHASFTYILLVFLRFKCTSHYYINTGFLMSTY